MREEALRYAAAGWRVLPIWWLRDEARADTGKLLCGCGNPFCETAGKHPLVKGGRGMENASSNPEVVGEWWTRWPEANIAVATGALSGIVVVDLDLHGDDDGEVELGAWAAGQGFEPPSTLEARTGGGGKHLVYRAPSDGGPGIRNATGWLPGVDLRGEGGYALVSPSRHESGARYEWLNDTALAELGPLLGPLRLARTRPGSGGGAGVGEQPSYDYREACRTGPPAGTRDHFFNARAFEFRKMDVAWEEAKAELHRVWLEIPQPQGNRFEWETVEEKMRRIWETVEPEPLPDWNPMGTVFSPELGSSPRGKDTDLGNAERFADLHNGSVRYVEERGWLVWNGRFWQHQPKTMMVRQAKEVIETMYLEAAKTANTDDRDLLLRWAKQSEHAQRIKAMYDVAAGQPSITAALLDFDHETWLMNVANGVIDLRTGELGKHDPKLMFSRISAVEYDPNAADPRWGEYIKSVTEDDDDLAGYLQRAAGYTLTADISEEVFFMVYGPQASGKSTFLDALNVVLGDLAMTTQPDTLSNRKNNKSPEHELARMVGKRMISTTELPENDRMNDSLVKQITGGDMVQARFMYRDPFDYQPMFKLWIATNHAPKQYDDAIWRRLKRIPFPRSVPKEEQDPRLKVELKIAHTTLAQTALRWMVEGCLAWQRDGLGTCKAVEDDTAKYAVDEDKLGRFLMEECWVGDEIELLELGDVELQHRHLYERYVVWVGGEGERPMSKSALWKKLCERRYTPSANLRVKSWRGIALQERTTWGENVALPRE